MNIENIKRDYIINSGLANSPYGIRKGATDVEITLKQQLVENEEYFVNTLGSILDRSLYTLSSNQTEKYVVGCDNINHIIYYQFTESTPEFSNFYIDDLNWLLFRKRIFLKRLEFITPNIVHFDIIPNMEQINISTIHIGIQIQ